MRILLEHAKRTPLMQPQDAVKLCYQHTFGGGHMIANEQQSLARLNAEIASTPQSAHELLTDIGGAYRLHLQAFSASGLRTETVNRLFVYTANHSGGTMESFLFLLGQLRELTKQGRMPFTADELSAYLSAYAAAGYPAVSHSETYRGHYAPAYRLVPWQTKRLLPVLQSIDAAIARHGEAVVGIDGMCGSGKTTLSAFLAEIYDAQLIHMDDYFLPFPRKTKDRLSEPGGNVDYERFAQELVGKPLAQPLSVRKYSCQTGILSGWTDLPPSPVRIVEGSYALHPHFARWLYDTRVYVQISPATQTERILARNGAEMLTRFQNEWIPMETQYEQAFYIRSSAIVIENEAICP